MEADNHCRSDHPKFETNRAVDALGIFADNLCNSDKAIRVATLRILCHYVCLECKKSTNDERPEKIMKTEGYQTHPAEDHGSCGVDVCMLTLTACYTFFCCFL